MATKVVKAKKERKIRYEDAPIKTLFNLNSHMGSLQEF